jgi:hypothetical protein
MQISCLAVYVKHIIIKFYYKLKRRPPLGYIFCRLINNSLNEGVSNELMQGRNIDFLPITQERQWGRGMVDIQYKQLWSCTTVYCNQYGRESTKQDAGPPNHWTEIPATPLDERGTQLDRRSRDKNF